MAFQSILFKEKDPNLRLEPPDFLVDLNIDQVINSITSNKKDYQLKPYFYTYLNDIDIIQYRHEIMQDLEHLMIFNCIKIFEKNMREMRDYLSYPNQLYYPKQKKRIFLDAIQIYCDVINYLANHLSEINLQSEGLRDFREYLSEYVKSDRFISMQFDTKTLLQDLFSIIYSIRIKDLSVTVNYETEETGYTTASSADYSAVIDKIFKKFQGEEPRDYTSKFESRMRMNDVEAKILDGVEKLFPYIFKKLDEYCIKYQNFIDETIARFENEIQFYIAYLEFIAKFKKIGLLFCYPTVTETDKEIYNYDMFDLALAERLTDHNLPVICNDFYLKNPERIVVVTGPNQGGKTTFARTFAQLHYFANLGCLVPGREARLFHIDNIFTHFEKEETIHTLRGKLEDDLFRIHHILDKASSKSIMVMNEVFMSTTLHDALFLSQKIMERIHELDLLCVWVTFIDELTLFSQKTISMVSTVDPEDTEKRTYKIIRKPADGHAHALSIAKKYRLTYEDLKERIKL